jgi:hypothetical protein
MPILVPSSREPGPPQGGNQARPGKRPGAFLTAEWLNLVTLNYAVDPGLLRRFVPVGTELDAFAGQTYLSLIGFEFNRTRLSGFPIPFHGAFEEVNLRFYVRHGSRRGVVFIRELVPKRAQCSEGQESLDAAHGHCGRLAVQLLNSPVPRPRGLVIAYLAHEAAERQRQILRAPSRLQGPQDDNRGAALHVHDQIVQTRTEPLPGWR